MSEKVKASLGWLLLVLVAALVIREVLGMFKSKAVEESRAETDAKLIRLRADMGAALSAVREENHQIAGAILDEVRVNAALPAGRAPQGKVGFAGAEPESIC